MGISLFNKTPSIMIGRIIAEMPPTHNKLKDLNQPHFLQKCRFVLLKHLQYSQKVPERFPGPMATTVRPIITDGIRNRRAIPEAPETEPICPFNQ